MKQWKCLNKADLQTSYININSIWMIDLKVKAKLTIFRDFPIAQRAKNLPAM